MDQEQAVPRSEEEQEETMDQEPEATEQPPEKKAKVSKEINLWFYPLYENLKLVVFILFG